MYKIDIMLIKADPHLLVGHYGMIKVAYVHANKCQRSWQTVVHPPSCTRRRAHTLARALSVKGTNSPCCLLLDAARPRRIHLTVGFDWISLFYSQVHMASSDGLEKCVLHRGRSQSDPNILSESGIDLSHSAGKMMHLLSRDAIRINAPALKTHRFSFPCAVEVKVAR